MKRFLSLSILLCAVICLQGQSSDDTSGTRLDSLYYDLSAATDTAGLIDALFMLSDYYYYEDYDSSLFYALEYLPLAEAIEDLESVVYAYWYIADIYLEKDVDSVETYVNLFYEKTQELGDSSWIVEALIALAYKSELKGDMLESLEYHREAYEIASILDDTISHITTLNNIGYSIAYTSDQVGGLEYLLQAYELAEQVEVDWLISDICCNIAYFFERIGDMETAKEYYEVSLGIDTSYNDRNILALSHAYYASFCLSVNEPEKGRKHLAKSKEAEKTLFGSYEKSFLYTSYMDYYTESRNVDSAWVYVHLTEEILKDNYYKLIDAYLNRQKAALYHLEGRNQTSEDYYNLCIRQYREMGYFEGLSELYFSLASVYEDNNQYADAYKTLSLANTYEDSLKYGEVASILAEHEQSKNFRLALEMERLEMKLFNERLEAESSRKSAGLLTGTVAIGLLLIIIAIVIYSLLRSRNRNKLLSSLNEKVQDQNELLETNIKELSLREEELEKANATKNKFFSIIGHDLKNPLASLIGFSELLMKRRMDLDYDNLIPIFEDMNATANFGFNLLENLLEWSAAQTEGIKPNPTKIPVKELLNQQLDDFKAVCGQKHIRIVVIAQDDLTIIADKNMIKTTLRNLIHNALKFTNTGGEIQLRANIHKEDIIISIRDNGIGISERDQENLFRIDKKTYQKGTKNEVGTGLGLVLCKEFIEQNGGKIWLKSVLKEGSTFFISFPLIRFGVSNKGKLKNKSVQ